jgi:hypothetical protein
MVPTDLKLSVNYNSNFIRKIFLFNYEQQATKKKAIPIVNTFSILFQKCIMLQERKKKSLELTV